MRYAFAFSLAAAGAMAFPANDACVAAVTGKGALGDGHLRSSHCASFLATTVTPAAITTTVTVTGDKPSGHEHHKRAVVTYCPNEVPNYASACDEKAYTTACAALGVTHRFTTTIAPTTTTKTVYVLPTDGACKTVTVTDAGKTVTVGTGPATTITVTETVHDGPGKYSTTTTTSKDVSHPTTSSYGSEPTGKNCLTDDKAKELVDAFVNFLEFTNYTVPAGQQGVNGRGYNQALSDATLTPDFVDISDSINFMAGIPLGSVTFANKTAFDIGQGKFQPEVGVDVLNIWHDCHTITWRWKITPPVGPSALPVLGINYMLINDQGKIYKNYAEFSNGAWLQSFGRQCAVNPVTVSPTQALRRRALLGEY